MTPPKYSFIVPTYNRLEELKDLIPSLENLDFPKDQYELIIVDDGSTDPTPQYIQDVVVTFKLWYFRQKNKGPGAARNLGMSKALGAYFIFVDSDCIVPRNYLTQVDSGINVQQPDAFGGPDTYHPSFAPLLKAINYSMTSFIGTGGTRGHQKSVAKYYPRSFNMGIRRKVHEVIGGFGDLRHGQDMDFSARIYTAEFKVALFPDAVVYHKRRTSIKKFFKQIFNWGIARINLAQRHPDMLKVVHLLPAILLILVVLILVMVALGVWPKSLLLTILLGILLLASIAFAQSLSLYKSLYVALLSVLTIFIQITAYGMGTLSALFQRFVLRKKTSRGFTKNYYK